MLLQAILLWALTLGCSPAPSSAAAAPLAVYFEVCFGMFNQFRAAAAALWLVKSLANSAHLPRPLHLKLPRLTRSLGASETAPFGHIFDVAYLQATLAQELGTNVTVSEEGPHGHRSCAIRVLQLDDPDPVLPHRWAHTTAPQALEQAAQLFQSAALLSSRVACVLVLTRTRGRPTRCLYYLSHAVPLLPRFGAQYLRLAPALQRLALQAVRRLPRGFAGVHLRAEFDFSRVEELKFAVLEECLRWLLVERGNSSKLNPTVYLAAGSVVFAYPEFRAWRQKTTLRVVTKAEVFPEGLRLGREEWGAVESLVLVYSHTFLGFFGSSLTEFVQATRQLQGKEKGVLWDLRCRQQQPLGRRLFVRRPRPVDGRAELEALARKMRE